MGTEFLHGGTFIDTADVYSQGRSEEIIGRWFASRPAAATEPMVLATKGRFPTDGSPNGGGLSARHLNRALDASLGRLGGVPIDLYQVHAFDPWTPLDETLRTLDGFVRAGKIRYYGFSNFTGWQLTKAVYLARELNLAPPVTVQPQYSLLVRETEWEIVPAAQDAAWASCRGARSAAAGCPASTRPASARRAPPGWATTRAVAWRPTTAAACSGPGTSSTRCTRWPASAACRWPRSRWPG